MHESLKLFNSIVNNKWLAKSSIILFLNKKDLFEKKIKIQPLTICFPEYDGKNEYEQASNFIGNKFMVLKDHQEQIYSHFTCATDSENIKLLFTSVTETILNNSLKETGLF